MPRLRSDSPLARRLAEEGRIEDGPRPARRPARAVPASATQAGEARRSKYRAVAVACQVCGFRHPSRVEAARCHALHEDPSVEGVDVHPTLTLAWGIHYRPDFAVYYRDEHGQRMVRIEDVKSPPTASKTDFRRVRLLMSRHCLGPLHVVYGRRRKQGYVWRIES